MQMQASGEWSRQFFPETKYSGSLFLSLFITRTTLRVSFHNSDYSGSLFITRTTPGLFFHNSDYSGSLFITRTTPGLFS